MEDTAGLPTLLDLCAGYELGQWRSTQFAKYLIRHLIEFIYPIEEWGAANDTVKGFDAVHFIAGGNGLELWLGEVKFYTDAATAIRHVLEELGAHLEADYLRGEFTWIGNKMRAGGPHYEQILRLLDDKTSLDQVFPVLHIPVLITYESQAIGAHNIVDEAYQEAIEAELLRHFESFRDRCAVQRVAVHLILVPLGDKRALQEAFDNHLRAAQDL